MTVYVFIFAWVIVFGILAQLMAKPVFIGNNIYEKRANLFFVILTFSVIIFFAALRSSVADTDAYINMFKSYPNNLNNISDFITGTAKRYPGFLVLTVILKQFISDNYTVWFSIIAVISGVGVMVPLYRYSCNFGISAFLFAASCQFIWMFNGMRQFLVAAIMFSCTGLILRKKFIPYAIIVCFLSTIHISVLILIPLYFIVVGEPWDKRTIIFICCVILVILFTSKFTGLLEDVISNTSYESSMQEFKDDDGTSTIRVLVESIPIIIAFIYRKIVKDKLTPIIKLSINMSLVSSGLYIISKIARSGILLGRLPIYFSLYNLILLPWLIKNIFKEKEKLLVYYTMIMCYIFFFYYQIVVAWDKLPYASNILKIHIK